MKKLLVMAAVCLIMAGCGSKEQADVYVVNPLDMERNYETVEIPWSKIMELLPGATAETVVVLDSRKAEIPSQVVYMGDREPLGLIFQATVPASDRSRYTLRVEKRGEYPAQAFGRYVPERKDDYAWENNLVAYRVYGPALEDETLTPGIDVWVKRTPAMIIDKWYKINDYHVDHGEGMDCYKVGSTLGGGASAPFVDGRLWLGRNYSSWERLDNGPVRTTVRLTYDPFDVDGKQVSLEKTISLDANTRFSRMLNIYYGDFELLPIAAGMPLHDGAVKSEIEGAVMLTEPASDLKGDQDMVYISVGVVMPGATAVEADGHWLLVSETSPGSPLVYWAGSGWNKGGIADAQAWEAEMERQVNIVNNPLQIEFPE